MFNNSVEAGCEVSGANIFGRLRESDENASTQLVSGARIQRKAVNPKRTDRCSN
jgi:hypothetical protein